MNAESQIYGGLSTAAGVVALAGTRIYPDVAAQNAPLPLIVFERRASEPVSTIHDCAPVATLVTVAVSAWAETRMAAEALADQVQLALRTTGPSSDRLGAYDVDTGAHAAVIEFKVWEP